MSFDQLSSLEAGRRRGTPSYTDDPEFQRLSQDLMNKLFKLNGNNQRLTGEVGHLGTRRDTPRVRERVHELIEESRGMFKEVGEGVKKIQTWEDVTVRSFLPSSFFSAPANTLPSQQKNTCNRSYHANSKAPSPSSKTSNDKPSRSRKPPSQQRAQPSRAKAVPPAARADPRAHNSSSSRN
jgi:hypothetical protein